MSARGYSVFPRLSLDREVSRWEEHLDVLTPVERHGAICFKREDTFAPLGYGGINGAKLRQLVWLVSRYACAGSPRGLVTGASVKSPQIPMAAAVARHFGLPAVIAVGGTSPQTAKRHENVRTAMAFGASFAFAKVAYNPALQAAVARIASAEAASKYFRLEYGITTTESAEAVEAFHRVGARQAENISDNITEIYAPAGSCNSATSLLYGVARTRPKRLRRVHLFGIGPTRLDWTEDRLTAIETISGVRVRSLFRRRYPDHPDVEARHNASTATDAPYEIVLHDLHTREFASYQDEMPASFNGIEFHPTYEGKIWRFLEQNRAEFRHFWTSGRALFWIVGSRPEMKNMPMLQPAKEMQVWPI